MAEKMWADISEAIEIEMGETKLIVVEDRDGHVPLVRTKHVDRSTCFVLTSGTCPSRSSTTISFVSPISISIASLMSAHIFSAITSYG